MDQRPLSPDGKYWWDGQKWNPVVRPARRVNFGHFAGAYLLSAMCATSVLLAVGALYFFSLQIPGLYKLYIDLLPPENAGEAVILWYYAVFAATTIIIVTRRYNPLSGFMTTSPDRSAILQIVPPLTFIAILLFAILRGCYAAFYTPVGLQPEDVGLDYASILQFSAVAIAVMLLAALLGASVVVIVMTGATFATWSALPEQSATVSGQESLEMLIVRVARKHTTAKNLSRIWLRLVVALLRIRLYYVVASEYWLRDIGRFVLLPPELSGGTASFRTFVTSIRQTLRQAIPYLLLAALPFGAVFVQATYASAATAAEAVKAGGEPRPLAYAGFPALTIRAEPASVIWIAARVPSGANLTAVQRCVYLGREGNDLVLFDVDHKSIMRIPTDSAIVTSSHTTKRPCLAAT